MKTILLILLPFISFAQNDVEMRYNELPDMIKKQVDSLKFKNAYYLVERKYLVESGIYLKKNKISKQSIDTVFEEDGSVFEISKAYRSGSTVFGWVGFVGIIIYMGILIN